MTCSYENCQDEQCTVGLVGPKIQIKLVGFVGHCEASFHLVKCYSFHVCVAVLCLHRW